MLYSVGAEIWAALVVVVGSVVGGVVAIGGVAAAITSARGLFSRRPDPHIAISSPTGAVGVGTTATRSGGLADRFVEWLTAVYVIENRTVPAETVYDLHTGLRARDGTEEPLRFRLPQLHAGAEQAVTVERDALPQTFLERLSPDDGLASIQYWVRFTDPRGQRWEAWFDLKEPAFACRKIATERTKRTRRRAIAGALVSGTGDDPLRGIDGRAEYRLN
jgi:hypothetical protein